MSDEIKKGLMGIVVDETTISQVMPEINSLTYRGYKVQDLCKKCIFEEVAYLVLNFADKVAGMGGADRIDRKGRESKQEGQNEHHRDFDDANGDPHHHGKGTRMPRTLFQ